MRKVRVSPAGLAVTSVQVHTITCEWVSKFDEDGDPDESSSDEYPRMDKLEGLCGSQAVLDADSNEFLLRHCVVLEMPAWLADDMIDQQKPMCTPWPDQLRTAARKACQISVAAGRIQEVLTGPHWFPNGFVDDTVSTAINVLVIGKAEGLIAETDAEIATYLAANPPKLSDDLTQMIEEHETDG